jgi:1,4-dihydroxy-2-naphthoate polyprenyltransferase
MSSRVKAWFSAFRLRTLPLALSSIAMGSFLAAARGKFSGLIFFLCCLTTIFLQVLSNLANDYGDSVNGADHAGRKGPIRAVQSGAISAATMKVAIFWFVIFCLASGITLLLVSFGLNVQLLLIFLGLGVLSIIAAVTYTVGKKPYGYAGLGDVSVLVFFGFVGVMGSHYLMAKSISTQLILPALTCGFFAMGVLNINNVRDIESDKKAGKNSIPVRIGKSKAAIYHWFLLAGGILASLLYSILNYHTAFQFLFLLATPLLINVGMAVSKKTSLELDPYLKQMALSTLLFVVLFGVGLLA